MRALNALILIVSIAASSSLQAIEIWTPDCLEDTERHAREYAQCLEVWDRNDRRCKAIGQLLNTAMTQCKNDNVEQGRIDAYMTRGFRTAGAEDLPLGTIR